MSGRVRARKIGADCAASFHHPTRSMISLLEVAFAASDGTRLAVSRELVAMSDWELERGLASSLGFDHDRRNVANRILRERYAGAGGEASLSGYWR